MKCNDDEQVNEFHTLTLSFYSRGRKKIQKKKPNTEVPPETEGLYYLYMLMFGLDDLEGLFQFK